MMMSGCEAVLEYERVRRYAMSRRPVSRQNRGRIASGGPTFSPQSVAGLVQWLRADLGVTIGTGVSAWADQSGVGDANHNATQATGANQPTLNASDAAYNNQATLSFNGTSQLLKTGTWSVAPPPTATMFVVGNTDGVSVVEVFVDGLTAARYLLQQTTSTNVAANESASLNITTTPGSKHIYVIEFNGASSNIYIDALTAGASGTTGASVPTGQTIGANFAGASFLNGKLAEILVYNSILSATNRAAVENYLGARYGVTIGA